MNEEESKETDTLRSDPSKEANIRSSYELREKNELMKIGLIVLIILVLSLVAIICILAIVKPKADDENIEHGKDTETCYSEVCVKTAKYLYENMDLSVNPCNDFYNYTCGNWGVRNPTPKGESMWDVNSVVENRLKEEISSILEKTDEKMPLSMKKARNFYEACLNTEFRNDYGREELQKIITKIGGFPMLSNNWNQAKFDWQTAFVYCDVHVSAVHVFFSFTVDRQTDDDKTRYIELEMQNSFYIGTDLIDKYNVLEQKVSDENKFRTRAKSTLKNMDSTLSNTEIEEDLNDFIVFEKKLATISEESSDQDEEKEVFTIGEMQQQYKDINWLQIFSEIFKVVNITITEKEKIYVNNPTYFKKLGKLLKNTPKRTLANYIAYTVVHEFGAKAIYNFEEDKDSNVNMKKLKKDCVTSTEQFFRVAVNYWYSKTILGKEAMHDLKGFMKQIKAALTLTINTNKWMQEKTKQQAQLKLNRMVDYIASPSEVKSDQELDHYYRHTGFISRENYVHAFKKMSKWIKYDQLMSLRDTEDKSIPTPSEVNSFYSPYDNKIEILIGFLSPPNFYPNAPLAVNVPAIGSTIGHEVTHGFDDSGSQFDSKGYKSNWWDKRTQKLYKDKVNCFIKQYSQFIEPKTGKHVNGRETVGENIADNGAIHQAYTAYKLYATLKHPEKDLKLPNEMNQFTKDQLFFIAYANTYCSNYSRSDMLSMLSDEHAPNEARVIVPLQNSEEFSKAFKCPKGSPMNPENKCFLW